MRASAAEMNRRRSDWIFIAAVLALALGLGAMLGTCAPVWPASYYPGGPAVRIYDGGTGAHDAATARRNLGISTGNIPGFRDSLSTLSYVALLNPLVRVLDSQLWLKNAADTTKKAQFSAASIPTGTTRTYTFPAISGTFALLEATNTFTTTQTIDLSSDIKGLNVRANPSNSNPSINIFDTVDLLNSFQVTPDGALQCTSFGVLDISTGLGINIVPKSAVGTARTYKIDNSIANTDFMMTGGTQTASGAKTLSGACIVSGATTITGATAANVDGTVSHWRLRDQSDLTKQVAANLSQITTTTTRIDTIPDYSGQRVIRINARDFVGQTANIGSTTICTSPVAGNYRVSTYGVVTGILGGAVTVTIGWTDPQQAQTATSTFGLGVGSYITLDTPVRVASGNITLSSTGYVTGTYSVYARVEALP
jgi:hypothetical protein